MFGAGARGGVGEAEFARMIGVVSGSGQGGAKRFNVCLRSFAIADEGRRQFASSAEPLDTLLEREAARASRRLSNSLPRDEGVMVPIPMVDVPNDAISEG